jgi:hypothetical protein
MLTGDLPRGEPGADAGPAPPETRLDAAPKTLRLIVARATDPEPLQRYRSVSDLLMDLRAYQRGEPASVDGTAGRRHPLWSLQWDANIVQRLVLAFPLVLGIAVVLLLAFAWDRLILGYQSVTMLAGAEAQIGPPTVQLPPALLAPVETVTPHPEPAPQPLDRSSAPTDDPVQFCAMVGTTEAPAEAEFGPVRYTGPAQPFPGLAWRCWNGLVLGCEGGPQAASCLKVNVSRTPATALVEFCRANPESEPPLSVAGWTTAYDWSCQRGRPLIARQRIADQQIDAFGYRIGPWYTVTAP